MHVLADRYTGIVLDLDGVCFRGGQAVPAAPTTVAALRERGIALAFATNNATRTAVDVAAHLGKLGIEADPAEVVTSAMAAATLLEPGTRCLVIGMEGLRAPLAERGCVLVSDPDDADAVVVGLDLTAAYDDLRRATRALAAGARYIGTNDDATLPLPGEAAPGAGALLAALSTASGRQPEIAGKPGRPLFTAAAARLPDGPLLMVGDRIETDIAGAQGLGWDTAVVLSGVTSATAAADARPRPTYVLDDVGGLLAPAPAQPPAAAPEGSALRVRPAAAADTDAIVALWESAGMLPYTPRPQRDLEAARAAAADLVIVAERDGRVVGILLGTCDGRRGWLQRLAVAPGERGKGVGRRLVEQAEERLAARGISQVNILAFADNDEAIGFWRVLGYRTHPVVMGTKPLPQDD